MHKLDHDILTTAEYVAETKKGLHKEHRELVGNYKELLEEAYANYIKNSAPCKLEKLTPMMGGEDGDKMKRLYDSKSSFKKKYWDEIERKNGGKAIKCPICGVERCSDLDHYVPREAFPEFAVFSPNLIPLCHYCNDKKSNKWLNDNAERIIFNAFYDEIPDKPICECVISIDENNLPRAVIHVGRLLDINEEIDRLLLTTIQELSLVKNIWQPECENVFRQELNRLKEDYDPAIWSIPEDYWDYKCQRIPNYQKDVIHSSYIARIVYSSIIESDVLKEWLCNELSK